MADRKAVLSAAAVAGVFLFALFVRTYWYVDAAVPGGDFLLPESDSYYQHRTVERIQANNWEHPVKDPLLNYPVGGINPNPPLWDWWLATWGAVLSPVFGGDAANHPINCPPNAVVSQSVCVSTWWVTEFSPALFGALTVLLVFFLGAEIWNWRSGILGAFLMATSTSAIENTFFGNARHYSFILFFIVLSLLFFVKALNRAREGRWVQSWSTDAVSGLSAYVRANQLSLAFAALSGVAFAGVALAWKGVPYVAGIMLIFGVVQVLLNHWRGRDSTHIFMVVFTAMLVGTLLSIPYYGNPALAAVSDTLLPIIFILIAWIIVGALFTATRDLPFVLVLPASIVAGAVVLVAAFFALPSVAQSLLAPLVYFRQTKLYTTIAEAHPGDFNTMVFGTGVLAFFIALLALVYLIWINRKTWKPSYTFTAIWAIVAFFMTWSAVRFMFNATPIFSLLGGWGLSLAIGRLRFEGLRKNLGALAASGGQRGAVIGLMILDDVLFAGIIAAALLGFSGNALWGSILLAICLGYFALRFSIKGGLAESLRRAHAPIQIVGTVLIALLLIIPSVLISVDAGMPPGAEDKLIRQELTSRGLAYTDANKATTFIGQHFGAFGEGFISDYWKDLFEWLATQDANQPEAQRPAFLSWWDYGHWSAALGHHPTVADNFQNGYKFAGNFIAAQNETHAIELFLARIEDRVHAGQLQKDTFLQAYMRQGLDAAQAEQVYATLADYNNPNGAHGYSPLLTLDQAAAALKDVEQVSGDRVRYFAMDVRLFPYDNPQTRGIDFGSIFYAPITLSDHNPDDYVEAIVKANVPGQTKREFNQTEWAAIQKDVRVSANIDPASVFSVYKYKEPFFNSMFYRDYIGTPVGLQSIPVTSCTPTSVNYPVEGDSLPGLSLPAYCMKHFRMVYYSPQVRMIKFFPGATLEGKVLVDGQPLPGTHVVAYDDAGDRLYEVSSGLLSDAFKVEFIRQHGRAISPRDFDVPHDETTTDANGGYKLTLPFSMGSGVTVRAFKDGAEVGNVTLQVSVEQAEQSAVIPANLGAIAAQSGSVAGRVFYDANHNRAFDEGDRVLAGAKVALDGNQTTSVTTVENGTYALSSVAPGRHQFSASLANYEMSQQVQDAAGTVQPGQQLSFDIPMELTKAFASGNVWRDADASGSRTDSEGVPNVPIRAIPDFRMANNTAVSQNFFSRDNGSLGFEATPGTYVLRGETIDPTGQGYAFGTALTVAQGLQNVAVPDNHTMMVAATPATVNLMIDHGDGNTSAASAALVLFVPQQDGLLAGERAPSNGTLSILLAPGTYHVFAKSDVGADHYSLASPLTLVVGTTPASAEGRLTKN